MDSNVKADYFDIRKLTTDDTEQYNKLLRYAFQVTEKVLYEAGWEDEDIKQSKFPVLERANVWGCFDGGSLVSQFAAYPVTMNIYSAIVPVAFITSVSTYPEYSGKGLMSRLMYTSLEEMRECRQPLALLYPYSIPLYRKKGWEIVSDKMSFKIRDVQLPDPRGITGYVRRVPWDNQEFMDLHNRFALQTHGCLFRSILSWEEYWRWDADDTMVAVYYSAAGEPMGYMVYLIKDDTMYIKEMIYLNSESRKGLWKYVGAHESMVAEVVGANYFSEPIAFGFADSDIQETIRPYIMGRIVDIRMFLKTYRCSPEITGTVTLNITDPFLEWNNGDFVLKAENGRMEEIRGKTEYAASMSVGTLTTLLLGYKRASSLAELERIKADPDTIQWLDRVLLHRKPYISDYI